MLVLSTNLLLVCTMFNTNENAPDTKISKWVTQKGPFLQNDTELELILLKREMIVIWRQTWPAVLSWFWLQGLHSEPICGLAQSGWTRNTIDTMVLMSYSKSGVHPSWVSMYYKILNFARGWGHGRQWHHPGECLHTACGRKALETMGSGSKCSYFD